MADQRSHSITEGRDVLFKDTGGGRALAVTLAPPGAAPGTVAVPLGATSTLLYNVDFIPTLTVHATYVAGDYVGESGVAFEVPDCARAAGGSGYIMAAQLIDKNAVGVAGELWIFDYPVTPPNDSAAWTISDADALHLIGVIPFTTYYASAANSVSMGDMNQGIIPFKCGAALDNLYACFVTRGAPAYASGDLCFRLWIFQN
jgi:hypothetical protein